MAQAVQIAMAVEAEVEEALELLVALLLVQPHPVVATPISKVRHREIVWEVGEDKDE